MITRDSHNYFPVSSEELNEYYSEAVSVGLTVPVYPGGQRQVYVLTPSTHVAPLRHLCPMQSSDRVLHLVLTSSQPARRCTHAFLDREFWPADGEHVL